MMEYDKPCTRCGGCCSREVCPIGIALKLSLETPCSALESTNGVHSCGIIANPKKHISDANLLSDEKKEWMAKYLKEKIMCFGVGCDSDF